MTDCVFHEDIKEQVADHENRISTLEIKDAKGEVQFESLCKRLDDLITVIKWFIGVVVAGLGTFAAFLEVFVK